MSDPSFVGGGLFAGIDDIVERHLGITDIGTRPPRARTRSACFRLSHRALSASDATTLIEELLERIEGNWAASTRNPSKENWRFDKQLRIADHNPSREKTLEKSISRVGGEAWANQMPTASGLMTSTHDRQRNVDLVQRLTSDRFAFIELKVASDTPLYAA
ncbi:MAG: hypothetical protein ABI906_03705, partial [Pseudomonadota bacterium]